MNAQNFIQLLEHPEHISGSHTERLRDIVTEFPYFQAAHALYLKGLKNQDSFGYNKALKHTAVLTTDRAVLFDYITSKSFVQNDISDQIKTQEVRINNLIIQEQVDVSALVEEEEQEKASKILDPNLFVEKENSKMTPKTPEETLSVGKPLSFNKSEVHSFSEWLKLSSFKPIDRSQDVQPKIENEPVTRDTVVTSEYTLSRKRKQQIIDSFIETNPKIEIKSALKTDTKTPKKENLFSSESLMTETLARVYVEQKNYKKAKQAFRILSLKYPEKSGFFADQIRAVEQLEEQKE